ncbi:hypothetical protein K504DRAFT_458539 [Pleomassaria siparia CBS 279.74]|uniref:Uncharacterized protein n=1 Tax=Pleomassaria siparia CBS 279.74 TaxID=1314801 RepID=A0A6G1K3R6_9PLEO|nr:hypothetical protein K504DRAFT_458539 [Pleomassaria siparia CBS 279.74]
MAGCTCPHRPPHERDSDRHRSRVATSSSPLTSTPQNPPHRLPYPQQPSSSITSIMMLAASPFYSQSTYRHAPTRSSPLSEHTANVSSRPFNFTMASQPDFSKKPVPQRLHKPNPVTQKSDVVAQRRRDMFFRRVQKGREDKKWDARGDQIQRLDFISTQKRWKAEKARQAPELDLEFLDQNIDEFASTFASKNAPQTQQELEEAEYVLAQEEYDLQQLIASIEENQEQGRLDTASQHYGSDDEDYDRIFMECAADTSNSEQQFRYASTVFEDADAMDMTDG